MRRRLAQVRCRRVQGGEVTLKPGTMEVRLTAVQPRAVFNVLVLTKKATLTDDDLKALELPPEVKELREYTIAPSNIVKFGDVDGSGKYAIVDILNDYSTIVYGNDGKELWRWTAPPTSKDDPRGNEAAGVLWDFHHTGKDELAHWREIDGKEWLVLCDGRTGAVIKQVPWPAPALPHVDNNYRMAVAKFHKDSDGPDTLLVFVDTGGYIALTAYDKDLNLLWQHAEHRDKDYFGHYIYPYDVNGDGVDEVVISHLCLDANGKEVWNNAKYFEEEQRPHGCDGVLRHERRWQAGAAGGAVGCGDAGVQRADGRDAVAERVGPLAAGDGGVHSGRLEDAAGGDEWANV
jgi:hypothetical protein